MKRRPLTFICAYYDNPTMLEEQQRVWADYPRKLKEQFHAIVTDDCSPRWPAQPHVQDAGIASFQLYRTLVDCRWNWLFCRNLGAEKARTDWLVFTDIDHVLPTNTLQTLMESTLDARCVYRFSRIDAPALTPYKPHPNSWCMTREMFDRVGGFDERFSGWYGSDADFRERVHAASKAVVMLPEPLIRYPREHIPDASTTTYQRKTEDDGHAMRRIRAARDAERDWKPKRVTFPYEHLVTLGQGTVVLCGVAS